MMSQFGEVLPLQNITALSGNSADYQSKLIGGKIRKSKKHSTRRKSKKHSTRKH